MDESKLRNRRRPWRALIVISAIAVVTAATLLWFRHYSNQNSPKRRLADNVFEMVRQATNGEALKLKRPGGTDFDRAFEPIHNFFRELVGLIRGMDEKMNRGREDVLSQTVLGQQSKIEAQIEKRIEGQNIVKQCKDEFASRIDAVRHKLDSPNVPTNLRLGTMKGFEEAISAQAPAIEEMFTLRMKREQAEMEFLNFMKSVFGQYQFKEGDVSFRSDEKSAKHDQLVEAVEEAQKAVEDYQRRRIEGVGKAMQKLDNSVK